MEHICTVSKDTNCFFFLGFISRKPLNILPMVSKNNAKITSNTFKSQLFRIYMAEHISGDLYP